MITCRELIDFIDSYLGRELPDVQLASFEEHLHDCPACEAYLSTYRTSVELARAAHATLDAGKPQGMPDELVKAILRARERH